MSQPLHRVEELTSKINSGKERHVRVLSVDSISEDQRSPIAKGTPSEIWEKR
jgi:hypothetical protein